MTHQPKVVAAPLGEVARLRAELAAERAAHQRTRREHELGANELQHANAELHAIFSSLPDLFLRVDARGMVVDRKGGGARGLDHLLDPDPWNVPLGACLVPDAARALETALEHLTEQEVARVEYAFDPDGDARFFEARAVQLPNRDSLVVVTEITGRVRAHQALLEERDERAAELRSFAMAASHDLFAPLRNIQTIAEWLDDDLDDVETAREHVVLLKQRVSYMQRLLRGMLDYAQAGGHVDEGVELVDVEALTHEIASLVVPDDFEVVTEDLPRFTTGRVPLARVLQNLIANAVKYHHDPPGRIIVRCREHLPSGYVFTVDDDGPGIAAKDRERAFTLFRRLSRKSEEGAGVGLALVRRIVRRIGGDVQLEEGEPRGLRVVITWPAKWPATACITTNPPPRRSGTDHLEETKDD